MPDVAVNSRIKKGHKECSAIFLKEIGTKIFVLFHCYCLAFEILIYIIVYFI